MKEIIYTEVEKIGKNISLLTILTFILGYIGFNTFLAIYQIPIHNTDISLIVSIGLLNLTYLFLFYITASSKRKPYYSTALFLYLIFNFFLNNPVLLASFLIIQFMMTSFSLEHSVRKGEYKSFKTIRERYNKNHMKIVYVDIVITVFGVLISAFFFIDFLSLIVVIYSLLFLFHMFKKNKFKPTLFQIILIFMFPIISMSYFINSSKLNIIGLNKISAEIITTNDTLKTEIVFSDNNSYYIFSDSLNTLKILNRSSVKEIKTIPTLLSRDSGISFFKSVFQKIKNALNLLVILPPE
jgi:hypothetical protein